MGQHLAGMGTRSRRMSYSRGESSTSSPRTSTSRRTRSTVRSPLRKTGRSPCCCRRWRSAARTAGMELVDAEGLGQIVVGAEVESLDLAALVGTAGEHDDRHGRALFPQAADDLEAVDAGQAEIEDHHDRRGCAAWPPAPARRPPPRSPDGPARRGWSAGSAGSPARRRPRRTRERHRASASCRSLRRVRSARHRKSR